MVNFTILAGGYTSFVVSYLFNSDTNSLDVLGQSATGANPSWISLHPTNSSILYAVNEDTEGFLQSFSIGAEGALTGPIDQVSSGGDGPAFNAPISTGQVAIMNYNSGNGKIIPTTTDPLHFDTNASLITFPVPTSHPHMAYQYNSEVFVPDLGGDKIWRLVEDGDPGSWKIQGEIVQPTGSGPRHIRTRGDYVYTIHELSSTLTQQLIPPAPNGTTGPLIGNFSIVPPNPPAGAVWAGAEILLAEGSLAYPAPYIYVSNRNTGVQDPRGDAIVVFQVEPELRLLNYVYTGLDQIRGMMIGGPDDEYIIAGAYAGSAGVALLKRTEGGANLEVVARNAEYPTRTSFVWL